MLSISFKKSISILSNTIISTRTILDNIPEMGVLDTPFAVVYRRILARFSIMIS
jgi:hypothetical protein